MRPWIAAITCLCFAVVTGCSSFRTMPPRAYDEVDLSSDKIWEIKTIGGDTYKTDSLSRTDSSFVVHTGYKSRRQARFIPIDPVEIPFDEVKSLGIKELSAPRTVLLSMVVAGAVVVLLGIAAAHNLKWAEPDDG